VTPPGRLLRLVASHRGDHLGSFIRLQRRSGLKPMQPASKAKNMAMAAAIGKRGAAHGVHLAVSTVDHRAIPQPGRSLSGTATMIRAGARYWRLR